MSDTTSSYTVSRELIEMYARDGIILDPVTGIVLSTDGARVEDLEAKLAVTMPTPTTKRTRRKSLPDNVISLDAVRARRQKQKRGA